jgi:hypothetical protein
VGASGQAAIEGSGVTGLPYISESDYKSWTQSQIVLDWLLAKKIKPHHKVLEIGPGRGPWDRADAFIDFDVKFVPKGKGIKADLAEDLIPFPNKTFDFVYCRHTLEDMFNPFHACREMSRVGKAGYIETPSPAAEMAKGVDANPNPGEGYRGYHHHRYIVWPEGNTLHFVPKYPLIEFIRCEDVALCNVLREGAAAWNSYYLWKNEVRFKRYEYPFDFSLGEYGEVLSRAINENQKSSHEFSKIIAEFEWQRDVNKQRKAVS